MGLEQAGHECVGFVEIDKFAQKSYRAIFNTSEEWFHDDVTTINSKEIPKADIWTFGFPCQDISIAGNRRGFKGERSSLFFAVTKLLRELAQKEEAADKLPTYLIAENVKGFLYVNGGWDFLVAIAELDEIGYDVEWQLLSSKDYGVPQHRERVFLIGHLRGRDTRKVFPLTGESPAVGLQRVGILPYLKYKANQRVYSPSGLAPTVTTNPWSSHFFFGDREEYRIRKLTPRETWRLQGFPDWAFDRAKAAGVSDNQLYKQAGNAVTVSVARAIGEKLGR